MRDHLHRENFSHPDVWTGRATNRVQWLPAIGGAACIALGVELAVDSTWTSGVAALAMSVVGCIAAGLLIMFGTLAFVHVAVKVDKDCLEVRCGHIGLPAGVFRSRASSAPTRPPGHPAAVGRLGLPLASRQGHRGHRPARRTWCSGSVTDTRSPSRWTTRRRWSGSSGTGCGRPRPARSSEPSRSSRLQLVPRGLVSRVQDALQVLVDQGTCRREPREQPRTRRHRGEAQRVAQRGDHGQRREGRARRQRDRRGPRRTPQRIETQQKTAASRATPTRPCSAACCHGAEWGLPSGSSDCVTVGPSSRTARAPHPGRDGVPPGGARRARAGPGAR